MSAESIIKTQARNLLKNHWVKAIAAMLITFIPFYIIDGSTTLISCTIGEYISDESFAQALAYAIGIPLEIIAAIFFLPLFNGFIRAYYLAACLGEFDIGNVFYYFNSSRYWKSLLLDLSFLLRMLIPAVLLFSPLIAFEIFSQCAIGGDFYDSVIYHNAYFLLSVLSTATTTLYATRYFTVFTASIDFESLSVRDIFRCSSNIMKGRRSSAAKLIFSFIPWMLLCLLVLPMFYVVPYMTLSLSIGAKWMTKATYEVN